VQKPAKGETKTTEMLGKNRVAISASLPSLLPELKNIPPHPSSKPYLHTQSSSFPNNHLKNIIIVDRFTTKTLLSCQGRCENPATLSSQKPAIADYTPCLMWLPLV